MIVDTNAYVGEWPFRRLPALPRRDDVTESWVGSLEGLWHKDVAGVNERLARAATGRLKPVGTVNVRLPDWEEDVRRCHEAHRMAAVRVHPNYHGYRLDDPGFARLAEAVERRGMFLQVVASMEDERTQHPLMRVPPVDLTPLADVMDRRPKLRVQVLNAGLSPGAEACRPLLRAGRVWFDIATLEGVGAVARLAEAVGVGRVTFGSHAPLFHLESAVLKVKEAGLRDADRDAILSGNARELATEVRP